jgi:uncharacterized protein
MRPGRAGRLRPLSWVLVHVTIQAPMNSPEDQRPAERSPAARGHRPLWMAAGFASLVIGIIGIFLPLLPTAPFVLLAAWCFARGSRKWERWLLQHPRFGRMVRDWRAHRAIPLRAKQLATVMMAGSSALSFWLLPSPWGWLPGAICLVVAGWMWWLPTSVAQQSAGR